MIGLAPGPGMRSRRVPACVYLCDLTPCHSAAGLRRHPRGSLFGEESSAEEPPARVDCTAPAPTVDATPPDSPVSPVPSPGPRQKVARLAAATSPIARFAAAARQPGSPGMAALDAARAAKRDRLESPSKPATAARKSAALTAPKYSWAALGTPPPSHEVLLYYLIAFRLVFWEKLDTLAQRPPDAGPLIAALPDGWFPLEQLGLTTRTCAAMLQTSPPKMVALVQMLRQPEMPLSEEKKK